MNTAKIFPWLPTLNRIVKFFIISDLFLWAGWGFLDPIFSIFVIQNIAGASLIAIGFLATIYWVIKGVIQIPISLYLDKTKGERDDFYALIFGLMITGVAAFALMTARTMTHVYIVQAIKAIGFAFYIPAWSAVFSRHLDKNHTAFDWALSSSSVSLAIGAAGLIGGIIASWLGFNFVFLMTGLMALISAVILLFVPNLILPTTQTKKSSIIEAERVNHHK
ncbi:MAG: MFS transporter [bacterium]|nr:MFS transporter [bacterium]